MQSLPFLPAFFKESIGGAVGLQDIRGLTETLLASCGGPAEAPVILRECGQKSVLDSQALPRIGVYCCFSSSFIKVCSTCSKRHSDVYGFMSLDKHM